jgi:hypothetical protein
MAGILQVPVSFFFDGAPATPGAKGAKAAPTPAYVAAFLSTKDGLSIAHSISRIGNGVLRRRFAQLAEQIAGEYAGGMVPAE